MDRALLAEFDERIAERGYENRSEALRDLVRADVTKAAWEAGEPVTATFTLVFTSKQRGEVARVLEQDASAKIVAQLGVPIDSARTIELVVVKGRAGELHALVGKIGGLRGVLRADMTVACVASERGGA